MHSYFFHNYYFTNNLNHCIKFIDSGGIVFRAGASCYTIPWLSCKKKQSLSTQCACSLPKVSLACYFSHIPVAAGSGNKVNSRGPSRIAHRIFYYYVSLFFKRAARIRSFRSASVTRRFEDMWVERGAVISYLQTQLLAIARNATVLLLVSAHGGDPSWPAGAISGEKAAEVSSICASTKIKVAHWIA